MTFHAEESTPVFELLHDDKPMAARTPEGDVGPVEGDGEGGASPAHRPEPTVSHQLLSSLGIERPSYAHVGHRRRGLLPRRDGGRAVEGAHARR